MADQSPCRGCGATITWVLTAAGKRAPMNADGSSHFATCSEAAQFKRPTKRELAARAADDEGAPR